MQSLPHIFGERQRLRVVVDLDGFAGGIDNDATILTALQVNFDLG